MTDRAQKLVTARSRLCGFSGSWQPRRLSELLSYEQPTPYLVSSTDYVGSGTPVLTAGKTFVLGHTDDEDGIYRVVPVIIFDDFTTASKLVTFPFKAKSSAMKILRAKPGTNLRFVYEHMQLINFQAVDHKRRWISEYSKLTVSVPNQDEQTAIADVLAGADAEISAVQRLLAKKRDIKKGMAQRLLTGGTRLRGFCGAWVDTTAGAVGTFKGGNGFPLRMQGHATGQFPFFKVSDMNGSGNERLMHSANNYVSESVRKQLGATDFPPHAIVFAKVGAAVYLERKRILVTPSCIDNNMAAMVVDPAKASYRFVHYALDMFRLSSLVATTALPSLNGTQLRSIPLRLPVDLDEQEAIANVLADADAEITILEGRLAKAKAIKEGMAQQLLTERIPLPDLESVA